jgi:ADP-ribose pyrophosphatase YjhB (NUDIX family)
MQNSYYYSGVNPTVDLIIVNPEGKILLIKRSETSNACPGMWAIPGGFIETEAKKGEVFKFGAETPEQAAVRELKEETNLFLVNPKLIPVGVFEGNQRDPRDSELGWSQSHAFIYEIPKDLYEAQKGKIKGLDDAEDADWKTREEIEEMDMAFDHKKIIKAGLELLYPASKKMKLK